MVQPRAVIRRFDALGLDLRLFSTSDGNVGVDVTDADIRQPHTMASLTGYGETADEAVAALWQAVEDMDTGAEYVRIQRSGDVRRYYQWNGEAWKEFSAESIGAPA